ncbi:MAG: CDP-alcohol phosphatidyltransferase family protein [Dehalococcoidales bacterium]|nr:MAG: CDP-alcohol phosphatidyltransferase family protein [Dehalococcoidales bacterium]
MAELSEVRRALSNYLSRPVVKLLDLVPVSPNFLSWFGFVLTSGTAVLIVTNHLFAAGFMVLVAGFFDLLDGALARHANKATRFGAVLDATLDRISESLLLLAILFVYARGNTAAEVVIVGFALVSSLMVSYMRARAEAIGVDCRVGLFTRAERVVVLALGLLLSQFNFALTIALCIIIVFSVVTILQRVIYIRRHVKD